MKTSHTILGVLVVLVILIVAFVWWAWYKYDPLKGSNMKGHKTIGKYNVYSGQVLGMPSAAGVGSDVYKPVTWKKCIDSCSANPKCKGFATPPDHHACYWQGYTYDKLKKVSKKDIAYPDKWVTVIKKKSLWETVKDAAKSLI